MMKTGMAMALMLALCACGQRADLAHPVGAPGPAVPVGATDAPTSVELMTPQTQAVPKRSDELLRQSGERRADDFDLPPS